MTQEQKRELHDEFEAEVAEWLKSRMRMTVPPTASYHRIWPGVVSESLRRNDSATARYIRGRADRIAIHPSGVVFEWEVKISYSMYGDLSFEVLPFMHHVQKSWLGVRCIYVCRNAVTDSDHGFTCHDSPPISVTIPSRYRGDAVTKASVKRVLGVDAEFKEVSRGSGQPFAVVSSEVRMKLPHWKQLVETSVSSWQKSRS